MPVMTNLSRDYYAPSKTVGQRVSPKSRTRFARVTFTRQRSTSRQNPPRFTAGPAE